MTHLVNGVSAVPQCPDNSCQGCKYDYPDFTLISPLDVE
eukprot:CAMPEP_0114368062 /NCGR_PEP_ID=MMETSP0101-20121206/30539_1 /TAXON_ID=38822 ORGANISM="Pteridomonas danica, Strain PT" /NCGR_SAMPLE_ID=MMETSP0101 /ASSEMBLY_ACC=CAM_ASM_000211 /LENGTH=38 /DNA_ID= /DNA_START= /DNA_END= /DNA_ORIENTATION=